MIVCSRLSRAMSKIVLKPASSDSGSFVPQFLTALREGYSLAKLKADALAGMTVAIVALPLSMAIAIASGAQPVHGLIAAIVGGFLVSALGGSRFQVGGPAGAFIVLVASTIEQFGYDGFLAATLLAGLMLICIGYLRLGSLIRFIPHAVIVGFSGGIAIIIGASQLKDFFGLKLTKEPAALLAKLNALWDARSTFSASAFILSVVCVGLILICRHYRPRWPGFIFAVIFGALATWMFNLPVETIGSKFGGIPDRLPMPHVPDVNLATLRAILPSAFTIALLGGIESLLSAVLADKMADTRHRPNCEIVAQGFANIGVALFGGLCATGTIARTATNIRAKAATPVAGIFHSVFILAFMLFAAPLASYIPLSSLAAILMVVVWNMADREEFIQIIKHDRADSSVLLASFLLTIFVDLPTGIAAGVALGALIFMVRAAHTSSAEDINGDGRNIRLRGALFTGTAAATADALALVLPQKDGITVDMDQVFLADASAVPVLMGFVKRMQYAHCAVRFVNSKPNVALVLQRDGMPAELFQTL